MGRGCECIGCCVFPNGRIAIIGMLLALVSYGLALGAAYGCHYMETNVFEDAGDVGVGLWLIEDVFDKEKDLECIEWDSKVENDALDSTWRGARAMGSIATASGFVTMVIMFCSACMSISSIFLKIAGTLSLLSSICSILTMIVFSADFCSNFSCKFGASAGVAIGACISFFITGLVICAIKEAPDREQEPYYPPTATTPTENVATATPVSPPPGTVTVTETALPDGGIKVTKTTVNADGSRTVEEIIKAAPTASATPY